MEHATIEIYTDGSYNYSQETGAWAAIIILDEEKKYLSGIQKNSTHNRMELLAVIEALSFLQNSLPNGRLVFVHTDSQYVAEIPRRKEKLEKQHFLTNKELPVQNADLLKMLIDQLDAFAVTFFKVRAHQKQGDIENLNREVDKLVRKLVRTACLSKTTGISFKT